MSTGAKHGLGRGLDALIPQKIEQVPPAYAVRQIPITQIEPNPHQPRKQITSQALDELTSSIREYGVLQPLVVKEVQTPYGARYQLIAGERRWRAAQRAGMSSVPALLKG